MVEVRPRGCHDGLGPVRRRGCNDGIGNLVERFVPADALPLAAAARADALERIAQALRRDHQLAVASALLAAARKEVRRPAASALVVGMRLLLTPDDTVPDVHV